MARIKKLKEDAAAEVTQEKNKKAEKPKEQKEQQQAKDGAQKDRKGGDRGYPS